MKILFIVSCIIVLSVSCTSPRKVSNELPGFTAEEKKMFDDVQHATFQYFWDGAEPVSGMARERLHIDGIYPQNDKNIVTSGGSGFGVMAIIAGIERGYITREQGRERLETIVRFLETADRFHGVWPHWWNGETGKVKPFSRRDDGGDLVETSFMAQGLLAVRQYFKDGTTKERELATRIDKLWREIDWNFYRNGKNVLYWHWSPNYNWEMNHAIKGYNECLITYVMAASSPTYPIPVEVYHEGWARNGAITNNSASYKGMNLEMSNPGETNNGGPLFWAHYSYLGLDPKGLKDKYADYWKHNQNHALINYQWCVDNPKGFEGYGPNSWGLTSSYSVKGYSGHAPSEKRDLGVIAPTAALSSFPYTPLQSMAALKYWYTDRRDSLFGLYGFYDAFSDEFNWYPKRYLAIDQGPIVVMMENYRSGLLWNLFMSSPEVQSGLKKLGFESPHLK